jgi:hypothetical protein
MAESSDEDNVLTLKSVIPWFLTLLTAGFGIWQFTAQQAQSNRIPFLTKQLELSFEASNTVAKLTTETNPAKWEEARKDFWRLFWGPLSAVEDQGVEDAMAALRDDIPHEPTTPTLPMRSLEGKSRALALAVRAQVLKAWHVDLATLGDAAR